MAHTGSAEKPSRIRVWCDELQRSAWVLLPRSALTVSDITRNIAGKLGLTGELPTYDIYMGDSVVLASEDARLIRDGDEIAIRNKRPRQESPVQPMKRARLVESLSEIPCTAHPKQPEALTEQVQKRNSVLPPADTAAVNDIPSEKMVSASPVRVNALRDKICANEPCTDEPRAAGSPVQAVSNLRNPDETRVTKSSSLPVDSSEEQKATLHPTLPSGKKEQPPKNEPCPHANPSVSDTVGRSAPDRRKDSKELSEVPKAPSERPLVRSEPKPEDTKDIDSESVPTGNHVTGEREGSEQNVSQWGWQKPRKPSNVHTGSSRYPGDRGRNAVYSHDEERAFGNDYGSGRGRNSHHDRTDVFSRDREYTGYRGRPDRSYDAGRNRRRGRVYYGGREYEGGTGLIDGRDCNGMRDYGALREHEADRGRGFRKEGDSEMDPTGDRDFDAPKRYMRSGGGRSHGDRAHVVKHRDDNSFRDRTGARRVGDEDDLQSRAVKESQENKSFLVGLESKLTEAVEEERGPGTKSGAGRRPSLEPDNAALEETKKELAQLFGQDRSKSSDLRAASQLEPGQKDSKKVAADVVCDNTITGSSCTILDMLKTVTPNSGTEDPGLYCRMQILVEAGSTSAPYVEPSEWIEVMLASEPTEKNELRICKVNKQALRTIHKAGISAKQFAPHSRVERLGRDIQDNLPILLNPKAVHKFSFDIRGLEPDEDMSQELNQVNNSQGNRRSEPKGNESEKLPDPKQVQSVDSTVPTKSDKGAKELKTGYENLATPLSARLRKEKTPKETSPDLLDELPDIDGLPTAAVELPHLDGLPESGGPFIVDLNEGDYPPLEAVDSLLGLNEGSGGKGTGSLASRANQPAGPATNTKPRVEIAIPRSAPAPSPTNSKTKDPRPNPVQSKSIPPQPVASPDSVIDLIEVDDAEVNATVVPELSKEDDLNEFRKAMMKVMKHASLTMKLLA